MSLTNPDNVVTKQDLKDFYDTILPYLGGNLPVMGEINKSDIYSTTEKVVGCWTDGRPIYQKTISFNASTYTDSNDRRAFTVATIPNCDSFVDAEINRYISNGATTAYIGLTSTMDGGKIAGEMQYNWYTVIDKSTNSLSLIVQVNKSSTVASSIQGIATLRYTKSTDAANSFNYASENDYSTTEKVIGTWIDGKKIFQRTFTGTLTNTTAEGTEMATTIGVGANIDTYVDIRGFVKNASGSMHPLEVYRNNTSHPTSFRVAGFTNSASSNVNSVQIQNAWQTSGTNTYYLTVKYTKTS